MIENISTAQAGRQIQLAVHSPNVLQQTDDHLIVGVATMEGDFTAGLTVQDLLMSGAVGSRFGNPFEAQLNIKTGLIIPLSHVFKQSANEPNTRVEVSIDEDGTPHTQYAGFEVDKGAGAMANVSRKIVETFKPRKRSDSFRLKGVSDADLDFQPVQVLGVSQDDLNSVSTMQAVQQ